MAHIADGIDFFLDLIGRSGLSELSPKGGVDHGGMTSATRMCYSLFLFMWLYVYHKVTQKDFSAVITASAVVQFVGFSVLCLKVRAKKSVAGLSAKCFVLFIIAHALRLTSTCIKKGYIPVDRSGHYFYQIMDIGTLLLACQLVYCCIKEYRHSYQDELDTFPVPAWMVLGASVILAYFVHGNFNRSLFFDIVWYASLYVETVCLLPQLYMMSKIGGKVQGITCDFVASVVAAKVMNVVFWIWAYNELIDKKTGSNLAGQVIIACYFLQLFFSADFTFYYFKWWVEGTDAIVLPSSSVEL